MTGTPAVEAVYVESAPEAIFGLFHPATTADGGTAVLICPPFGWDEVSSYRSRGLIARALAAAGHPALRIDLPGTGDSAGWPSDPGRVEAWTAATAAAAGWLRERTGCARVAAFGIGLGGMMACLAASEGAPIDDLALWGVPARGRTLLRELRAFGQLNSLDQLDPDEATRTPLPEGLMEVGGYAVYAETGAALDRIDLSELVLPEAGNRRVLLFGRDGVPVDRRLRASLEEAGAAVDVADGDGYGEMAGHPQESRVPERVVERLLEWLAEAPGGRPAYGERTARPASESQTLELTVGGVPIRESALWLDGPAGRLFGIVSEPVGEAADLGLVLLNPGSTRRSGPNRMWVEVGRRWAARGVPTLRLDVEGIGDADGDETRYRDTANFYTAPLEDQVMAAVDELAARGVARRFALAGLCSGAYWAFHALRRHDRVSAAFMLNLFFFYWDADLSESQHVPSARRLMRPSFWLRLVRGQANAERVRAFARWAVRAPVKVWGRLFRRRADRDRVDADLDLLRAQDKRALLLLSSEEPLLQQLRREGRLDRDRWPNVELQELVPADHTFRALWMQQDVHAALDSAIESELRRSQPAAAGGSEHPYLTAPQSDAAPLAPE